MLLPAHRWHIRPMALQPCNQCGESISVDAVECPRCGAWRPTDHAAKVGRVNNAIIIVAGLLAMAFIIGVCA